MTSCTFNVPDLNASGDNLYGPRICWQPFIDWAWDAFDFDHDPSKIPYVDLTGALQDSHPSCWLSWDEGHLSPLGHRLVAKRLEAWLAESGLLPAAKR